jgi:hypothetical protein
VSRRIGGTEGHGRLRAFVQCECKKNGFVKIIYVVVQIVCFLLLHTSYARNRGHVLHHKICHGGGWLDGVCIGG